jgi:hypothetical protein
VDALAKNHVAAGGSARRAEWAWYVDGAIGSTLQIGSTP